MTLNMYKADIEITCADGSIGAKVIYAATLGQVMDDAEYLVTRWVREGRETGNEVISHKVIGGEAEYA